jgi:hypothetical protein
LGRTASIHAPFARAIVVRSFSSRLLLWIAGAGALALACGPHVASNEGANATETIREGAPAADSASPLATSLNVSLDKSDAQSVTLTLNITNASDKRVELTFPSGQTHDFVVLDSAGTVVWKWSEGRLFTQAMQNKLLTSRESAKFEETWNAAKAQGRFTAVATLRSSNYPIEEKLEFTLP